MLITRPALIERIRPFYCDDLVKVITGMRRAGKSSLLRLIATDLAQQFGRPESAFLAINFESISNRALLDPVYLCQHITKAAKASPCRFTVLLDEIQNVHDWELCINSLRADNICDIYITGSNSKLLSGELATHLAGRTIKFQVFPFSFAEYCNSRRQQIGNAAPVPAESNLFEEYIVRGGMPGLIHYTPRSSDGAYLRDVFESIVLKDVVQRWKIRNTALLEVIYRFLMSEIGHRISAGNIEKYLKSEQLSISRDTLLEFIRAGTETFAFERLEGRDVQGRKVLKFQPKLYLGDHGFREAYFPDSNKRNIDQVLENIVCIELLRRGWTVSVGEVEGKEIDFIAEKDGEKLYLQVSYLLASEDTVKREFAPLLALRNNWPKLVLSMDPINRSSEGIVHKHIIDFLLDR